VSAFRQGGRIADTARTVIRMAIAIAEPKQWKEAGGEPLRLVMLDENRPTGGFFRKNGVRPW
jgi:hypothetical protein